MENNAVKEKLYSLFGELEKLINTETVIGEPITVGEITLVPIIDVIFAWGTEAERANSRKKEINANGLGGAGGVRMSPKAILIIKHDDVTILPIKEKSNIDDFLNLVPDIVSKVNADKD